MKYFQIDGAGIQLSPTATGPLLSAVGPSESDRALLSGQFHLDDYDIQSALDADEVPRLEGFSDRLFIIWKLPETATIAETVELGVSVTGICLAGNQLALIRHSGEFAFTDREFRGVRDVRDAMLAVFLHTVHHFVGHLRVIRTMGQQIEAKITVSMENKHLLQMFSLSESLVYYLDAIEGNSAVLLRLRGLASQYGFEPRHLELLDDIILENAQAGRQAQIFSTVLSGLMDARASIVNNNMNVLLKNLTLITIVFLPLNLIASIGGMSEWSMMTAGLGWPLSYLLFIVGMVAMGWGTWRFMRRFVERSVVQ